MPKDGKELCCRPRVFGGKAYKSDGGEADARAAQADAALESPRDADGQQRDRE